MMHNIKVIIWLIGVKSISTSGATDAEDHLKRAVSQIAQHLQDMN